MRIAIDLDGVICNNKLGNQDYFDLLPINGSIEIIQKLKKAGHEIIIYTSRNMKTYGHNIGKVNANQIKIIVDWLIKYNIPYDEIWNKPNCDIFIDDKAIHFKNWKQTNKQIKKYE